MAAKQDPDLWRSASHRSMIAHLPGPFRAGAVDATLAATTAGRVVASWSTREPLLLIGPKASLGASGLRVAATLNPDGVTRQLPVLDFAPYTEAGAFLPLDPLPRRALPGGPDTRTLSSFTIDLALSELSENGTETALPASLIGERLEIRLLEGMLGRLTYLLGAEKQRIRRQAREVASARLLGLARDDALDRIGADLGVPRFVDEIRYDSARKQIVTGTRMESGRAVPEPDGEYRLRLGIYRPFLLPTTSRISDLLNGSGTDAEANRGPMGKLGFTRRFRLLEEDNEFAIAIHLVSSGGEKYRNNFLSYLRSVYLTWPSNVPAANTAHARRYIPEAKRASVNALRGRLRAFFRLDSGAALAPMLASALDRAGRCLEAVGVNPNWRVLRAQDGAAGSRYELGLGVDVEPLSASTLREAADFLAQANRRRAEDPEIEALLKTMSPRPLAEDPEGAWLLGPCGLRTVHRLDSTRVYLSHLPTFGMAITAPSTANPGEEVQVEVRYEAPGTPGSNVVLAAGLQAARDAWVASGGSAWTVLSDAAARTRWSQAAQRPAGDAALGIFLAAGLPAVQSKSPAPVVEQLNRLPGELLDTVSLAAPQVQRILAGQPEAVGELQRLVGLLQAQGLAAVLPLVTGPGEVLLVVSAIGLPEAGLNLSDRRATGFRWYVVPIEGKGGEIKPVGSRTVFVPAGGGLTALVALGYARRGLTDPYEFRVDLPDDARLNLRQYEFLMNLLQHVWPLGVEINTYDLRQRHVDLNGDGVAEPLPPTVAKTYRQFRRSRQRGEVGVTLEGTEQ